jgi:ComF family protein
MKNILASLKELIYPAVCLVCTKHLHDIQDIHLCPDCWANLHFIEPPMCSCCGKEFFAGSSANHLCSTCLTTPYSFSKARSLLSYNDDAAQLVHSIKYGRQTAALSTFNGIWEKRGLKKEFSHVDLVLPVPLHFERLQWRGYNQALLLAELFFHDRKEIINPFLLQRVTNTPPQTGLKGRERRKNVLGAFAVKHPRQIAAKNILLVDDVFTTGSTLNECAKTLMDMGAEDVQAVTLARVQYH